MERYLELHPGTPQRGFDHWLCIDFQNGPEFLGFQKLEVHLIRYCANSSRAGCRRFVMI